MKYTAKKRYLLLLGASIVSLTTLNAKIIRKSIVHEAVKDIHAPQGNGAVQEIQSLKDFDNTLSKNKRVIAQLYNKECSVCQRFEASGIYQELAKSYPDITFVKIEKRLPQLHQRYNVMGYPTFVFLKEGNKIQAFSGAVPKKRFEELIEKYVSLFNK